MTARRLSYAVITAARDEEENLPRLAQSLVAQRVRPELWVIVDNGSRDSTLELAQGLEREHGWVRALSIDGSERAVRGAPIVRAFTAGLELVGDVDVVANVDADVSFGADFFDRLLVRFEDEARLGIASGAGYELEDGSWRRRHLTGSTVWGATRTYRRACLDDVLPLEERLGWDGIDEFKANARGWRTGTFADARFRHHRPEGIRDGEWRMRVEHGRFAHYVGYRAWYLVLRALHNARRHPAAVGMIWGYVAAAASRAPRLDDAGARAYVRRQQRLRTLHLRIREALGGR